MKTDSVETTAHKRIDDIKHTEWMIEEYIKECMRGNH